MGNSLPIRRPKSGSPVSNSREQEADDFFLEEDTPSRPSRSSSTATSGLSSQRMPEGKKSLPLKGTQTESAASSDATVTPRLPSSKPKPSLVSKPKTSLSTPRPKPSLNAPRPKRPDSTFSSLDEFDTTKVPGATPRHSMSFDGGGDVELPETSSEGSGKQASSTQSSKLPFGLKVPGIPKRKPKAEKPEKTTVTSSKTSDSPKEVVSKPKRSIGRKPKGTKIEWINGEPVQVVTAEEEEELNSGVESQLTPTISAPTANDTLRFYGRKTLIWLQIPIMLFLLSFYALAVIDTPEIILSFVSPAEVESLFGLSSVLELVATSQEMTASMSETHLMTGMVALVAWGLGWNARRLKNPVVLLALPLLAASFASGFFLTSLLPTLPYYVPIAILIGGFLMVVALYLLPTNKIRK